MVNLLLLALMIAALLGMVFCNRQQKKNTRYQVIALSLLVLVIASGGMFMCRLGTLSVLGLNGNDNPTNDNDKKLRAAQGFVTGNFIRNSYKSGKNILIIMPEGVAASAEPFINELRAGNIGTVRIELIRLDNSDNLITPAADHRAESRAIDAAIARHSDSDVIIFYGLAPSGASIRYLQVYEQPYEKRAKIIVLGLTNLNEWAARQIREGFFDAMIITDLTKASHSRTILPDNHMEVFDSCYVLITRSNLNRNRRYFH